MKKTKNKLSQWVINLVVLVLAASCLFPLLNTVAISFSSSAAATAGRVKLLPVDFTFEPYLKLIKDSQMWRSFMISVIRTVLGTVINLALVLLMAYPLSKNTEEFRSQKFYMGLVIFAMIFSGGMIPVYMIVQKLHLLNTLWALILPSAVGAGNIILMMNFFRSVPKSLEEAATIDGANPFQILFEIFIPVSTPCIATIILFCIVGHWNDYFSGILYIQKSSNYPLQTYISMVTANFDISKITDVKKLQEYLMISEKTLNAAKIVVSVIPLLPVYVFLQKYFTTGLVIGSVKE